MSKKERNKSMFISTKNASKLPKTLAEAKSRQKTNLIILLFAISLLVLYAIFPKILGDVTALLGLVTFGIAGYFGLTLYVLSNIIKSFKDTTCDHCQTRLVYDENTKYTVIKKWRESNQNQSNGDILSKSMYSVSVDNTCPKCRRKKTFQTTLATDMIRVTGNSTIKSEVDEANLEDVIKGYFSQRIRK
jgi:RNase P subunit RPR2